MSPTTLKCDWHILVPVYNEADNIEKTLNIIQHQEYSNRITFINDASTDHSGNILDSWKKKLGCNIIHLEKNQKKEGAIRKAMEDMFYKGELPEYTILLDADSYFAERQNSSLGENISQAIQHMIDKRISGLAFRIEANTNNNNDFLKNCVFYDYTAVQIDNLITSKSYKLWVINGPGGLFNSLGLLQALQQMKPDFETGDLMITINLMKNRERIDFWPAITVITEVPPTTLELFNQRRRWERGTIKVLWNERSFYLRQLAKLNILSLYTFLYLIFPIGITMILLSTALSPSPANIVLKALAINYPFWTVVSIVKCFFNKWIDNKQQKPIKIIVWSCMNGILFILVTGPARLTGLIDAIKYLIFNERK